MSATHDPFRPSNGPTVDVERSPEESGEDVPVGSTKEVLEWVGGDKDRAQRALDAEQSHEKPRKGAVAELKKVLEDE